MKFQPNDNILTKEGFSGTIVQEIPNKPHFYEVILNNGKSIRSHEDLRLGPEDPHSKFINVSKNG